MKKLAIIHTTTVTVDLFKQLASELIPGCTIINFVDDSILPQLAANGGELAEIEQRWVSYARYAEQAGADCILNACSSVGDLVWKAAKEVSIPVLRVDESMAEQAIVRGNRIGVAATLSTTLNPTMKLLQLKADEAGKIIQLIPILAEEAYRKLLSGDQQGHDSVLASSLQELGEQIDVVVLAQASMSRVVGTLSPSIQSKFLSSPRSGMMKVRQVLGES